MSCKYKKKTNLYKSKTPLKKIIATLEKIGKKLVCEISLFTVIPPLVYPDLGWPFLAGEVALPAPPSIPTLADRLHNYRQQVALANAQSTVVTHASQGATTTLVERTRNLRHWLKQAGIDGNIEGGSPQATL